MKRIVMVIAVAVLLAVGGFFGWRYFNDVYLPNKQITDTEQEQREYFEKLKPDSVPQSNDAEQDVSEAPSLEKLEAANSEAVGWITIDGTVIDYPVVQAEDNDFYLEHGVDGQYNNGLGCPFLDYRCDGDFSKFKPAVEALHRADSLYMDVVKGDTNGDGVVDIIDATLIQMLAADKITSFD